MPRRAGIPRGLEEAKEEVRRGAKWRRLNSSRGYIRCQMYYEVTTFVSTLKDQFCNPPYLSDIFINIYFILYTY